MACLYQGTPELLLALIANSVFMHGSQRLHANLTYFLWTFTFFNHLLEESTKHCFCVSLHSVEQLCREST